MDLVLSSNSLVNVSETMHRAATGLTPRFTPRMFVDDAAHQSDIATSTEARAAHVPHILLATTGQLPSTARLAMELHEAGARVSLISPSNHPAKVLELFSNKITYRASTPQGRLEATLRRLAPDLVIPCDERTVRDLHAIARNTKDPDVKRLVEASTAPAASYPVITSRAALLALAQQEGIRVPPSMPLPDQAALDRWTQNHPAPFVLKADGSWAGFGVRIISEAATAASAYSRMTRPVSARVALRESLLEGNNFEFRSCFRRERPAMSVQGYIDGWPANIGVACWQGEVLAAICVEAVATTSATGPSTAARIIHNADMIDAATRMVRALGLSGMIGFDFMIEAATGAAYLIEMNPRNTPICALRLGPGRDLAEAIVARIAGRPVRERAPRTDRDIVVFFPDTWEEDPASHFLNSGYHDVPWEQPDLVRVLMMPNRRDRYLFWRMLRRLWLAVNRSES